MESTEKGKDSLDIITGAESKVFPPENSNTVDMGEWAEEKEQQNGEGQKIKTKLEEIAFSKDTLDQLEQQCDTERQVKRLIAIKPDLTKTSTYRISYRNQPVIPNIVNRSGEYSKLQGPHIGLNSLYNKSFDGGRGDDLHRPKPENLLKVGGPSPLLTSYTSGFPGHRGPNQYIKPRDKEVRGKFPLASTSTYQKQYPSRSSPKAASLKMNDSLKLNSAWLGKSSYESFYCQPNPENYPKKVKVSQIAKQQLRYPRQYQTTYRNSFFMQSAKVSPAKKTLENGTFEHIKSRFIENGAFKTLSPEKNRY